MALAFQCSKLFIQKKIALKNHTAGGNWQIEELCLSPVLYPWLCVLGFIIDTRRVSDTSHKEEDSRFCLTFSPRMVMTFKQEDKYCKLHILYIKQEVNPLCNIMTTWNFGTDVMLIRYYWNGPHLFVKKSERLERQTERERDQQTMVIGFTCIFPVCYLLWHTLKNVLCKLSLYHYHMSKCACAHCCQHTQEKWGMCSSLTSVCVGRRTQAMCVSAGIGDPSDDLYHLTQFFSPPSLGQKSASLPGRATFIFRTLTMCFYTSPFNTHPILPS